MNRLFRSIVSFGRKHDNVLFTVGEIGLATAGVIFAVKNTEKYILELPPSDPDDSPVEKTKKVVSAYWPTAVCLGGFIGLRTLDCIHTQNVKSEYAKALMACQAALAAKKPINQEHKQIILKDTQNKSDEHLEGDEMEELRDENTYDQYSYQFFFNDSEMPEPEESVYSMDGYGKKQAFYIPITGRYFISTLNDVQQAEINCRLMLQSGQQVFMNDLYKQLGIGTDGMGHDLYMDGDPSEDEDGSGFSFDLAPGLLYYDDGFDSSDLIYTINPNRFIYDINVPR